MLVGFVESSGNANSYRIQSTVQYIIIFTQNHLKLGNVITTHYNYSGKWNAII